MKIKFLPALLVIYCVSGSAPQPAGAVSKAAPNGAETLPYGFPIPRIELPDGYTATVYSTGIEGVDGLALSPAGDLFAASETGGRVYRIGEGGARTVVMDELSNPEGIVFDDSGVLYVVEDVQSGRLLALDPGGEITVLATGLEFSEGVAVESCGSILVTETSLGGPGPLLPVYTRITKITASERTVIGPALFLWSYSDIAVARCGTIYVANELSGTTGLESIFSIDPLTLEQTLFCKGLYSCEGLSFSAGGVFPLYVAEENTGEGNGRLSIVDDCGIPTVFAGGFYNIEDVAVDESGRIFISEDTTGMIIMIALDNPSCDS